MPIIVKLPFIFNHPYTPMNMVPFVDVLSGRGDFLRQIVLNIIMTVPFGFLYPLSQGQKSGFFKTIFCCFLLSLGIELLQPLISGSRSSDITDLITIAIQEIIKEYQRQKTNQRSRKGGSARKPQQYHAEAEVII